MNKLLSWDPACGTKDVLYSQIYNPSGEPGIVSQEFPMNPDLTCQAADDFVVPAGEFWQVETIQAPGSYAGTGPVLMANIFLYTDDMGMPGPPLFMEMFHPVQADPTGNLEVILAAPWPLNEGRYWLSIQPVRESVPAGEWLWEKQSQPVIENECYWQNPAGGFYGQYFIWTPASVVWGGMGLDDWNLSFSLSGMIIPVNPFPIIADFYPPNTFPGEIIYLGGTDFGTLTLDSYIEVDGFPLQDDIWFWENDSIVFNMPLVYAGDSINIRVVSDFQFSNVIRLGYKLPDSAYFFEPLENQIVYWDTCHISVMPETYGSHIDSAFFFYKQKDEVNWTFLGVDTCGTDQYIGTYNPVGTGDGWACNWDVSLIQEDTFDLRTDMFDSNGFILTGQTSVIIDKTPAIPFIEDSSNLTVSKSIENDSVVLYYTVKDNKVNNAVLFNICINQAGSRDIDTITQWYHHILDEKGDSLKDDICAPTAGASCLKWLAKEYCKDSLLDKTNIKEVVRDLVGASGTKNGYGTEADGIKGGLKTVFERGTGRVLNVDRNPPNNSTSATGVKMRDKMLEKFKDKWDVLLEIRQKDKNGKARGHWVTMSSYHAIDIVNFNPETQKYESLSSTAVDFMDPGTGEITWGFLINDDPPQFIFYDIDSTNKQGKSWIGNVVSAKPGGALPKKSRSAPNFIANIPVPGPGTYRYAIAASDLESGIELFKMYALSASQDTLAEYLAGGYVAEYRPYAFFTSDRTSGVPPLDVQFTSHSTPPDSITYYEWDFGDGNKSYLENPLHTYTATGIFDVSLVVSDGISYDTLIIEKRIYCGIALDVKAFLEGPFNGSKMEATLNPGNIPLSQPYNTAPWFYNGTEQVDSLPNDSVVDWLLVELRETSGSAATATGAAMIARTAVFITSDGTIIPSDNAERLFIDYQVTENLYLVIRHRNHAGVMSAVPLTETDGVFSYDFTTGSDQAYGGSNGHKQIAPGIWGLTGADGNADNQINNGDKIDVWINQAGGSGYLNGDFNMDIQVNNGDKVDIWIPNTGLGSQVPD
ncbi:MAG: PKD domain-containing protein [Bacteroidales bacterium]|nr:PKD domain-containing protein [Bacteroidales bacterium]